MYEVYIGVYSSSLKLGILKTSMKQNLWEKNNYKKKQVGTDNSFIICNHKVSFLQNIWLDML